MRKSNFSEHQFITILKTIEEVRTVKDVFANNEISGLNLCLWKSKYSSTELSDVPKAA